MQADVDANETSAGDAVALRVLQADYDVAIAARQTTVDQEATYRKIADSFTEAEAQAKIDAVQADVDANEASAGVAVGLRVLQADYDVAIAARQTTVDQEATYRKIADSFTEAEAQAKIDAVQADVDANETSAGVAVGLRVLQTDFDTAIAARQTTVAQEAAYRKVADSYTDTVTQGKIDAVQADVDANEASAGVAVGLRVLQSAYDAQDLDDIADSSSHVRMTTAERTLLTVTHAGLHTSHANDLNGKQDVVGDGDLTIARTTGLQSALDGKISSTGAQTFSGDIVVTGSGAGGGLTVNSGDIKLDGSKSLSCGGGKLTLGHDNTDGVLYNETGDLLLKNYKNGASGAVKIQTRSSGSTYHNEAFAVSYDGNCSTSGDMTVSGSLYVSASAPTAADDPGTTGEIRFSSSHIFYYTGGAWKRAAFGTW